MTKTIRVISCVFFMSISFLTNAQELNPRIMSLFIINFAKNMEWSNAPKDKFTFATLGQTPVYAELSKSALTKKIGIKQIIVKQIDLTNLNQLKSIQVLFIPESETKNWGQIKNSIKNLPILVITEKKDFVKQGACISFILDENDDFKTKFQLNQMAVRNAGINMNLELVSLAILME